VKVETDTIWFDTRALTLGLLAAGTDDERGLRSYAGRVFRTWVEDRIPSSVVAERLKDQETESELIDRALALETPIELSASVKDLAQRATFISDTTINTTHFDGRHLFAAMIQKGSIAEQVRHLFGISVAEEETAALMRGLIEEISLSGEESGTLESWEAALDLTAAIHTAPSVETRILPGLDVIRFSHDRGESEHDVLEIDRDVEALAKLICLRSSTPLAVAIFGGWGSGKTTFMEKLDDKVEELAREEARWIKDGQTSPFVTRLIQIRFNAWQFVDANLWASLTAEFFDQLRAGGWRRAGTARHAGLVEKVNTHVHALTREAAVRRAAVVESNRNVLDAQEARDAAAVTVRQAGAKAIGQVTMDALGEIYDSQRRNLKALGISSAGTDPTQSVNAVIEAVRSSRSILQQGWTVVRLVWKYRRATALAALFLLVAAGCAWLFQSWFESLTVAAAISGIGALGIFARATLPALRLVGSVGRRSADLVQRIEAADESAVRDLMGKDVALRNAAAEAAAQVELADRADRVLARYVNPTGPANPPRLLRYVLEDDPEAKAFEKEIGLIGRARRLFQAVNDIIAQGDDEAPQRIVLYIDDLDRCTEEQVYNVLQAIHLLLAFDSFAVVVGVDVKWIEGALAAEFAADRLPVLSEIERRQHAVHYLEKIFQVAFWLDPLSASGKDGGSFAAFVKALTKPEDVATAVLNPLLTPDTGTTETNRESSREIQGGNENFSQAIEIEVAVAKGPQLLSRITGLHRWIASLFRAGALPEDGADAPVEIEEEQANQGTVAGPTPLQPDGPATEPIGTREAFRTVEIEEEEIRLLASDKIAALAGSTPRSVKRLINVYRLVRSRLVDDSGLLLGSVETPPDYPLAALATAIETGQSVEVALAFLNALKNLPEETAVTTRDIPLAEDEDTPPATLSFVFETVLANQFRQMTDSGNDADKKGASEEEADHVIINSRCPALAPALARVHELRRGSVAVGDVLRVAKLARRFSFNRYQ
jgi:hypothetical protein